MANEGSLDRAIRLLIGLALLSLFFVGPRTPWALLGFIPLLTGALGVCPAYRLFGFSTRRSSNAS